MPLRPGLLLLAALYSATLYAADAVPVLFAPGLVSTGDDEWGFAMTAEGNTVYFNKADRSYKLQVILEAHRDANGQWNEPRVASFSGRYRDIDPALSPDGKVLVFASNRPRETTGEQRKDFDLWAVERQDDGSWGEPRHLGEPVNSSGSETNSSIAADGTLYFAANNRPGGLGQRDLYRARRVGRGYATPELLGAPISTGDDDSNHFIAPDQSYLLFLSNRAGGHGENDLYIAFRQGEGWSTPSNLGPRINQPGTGVFTPFVSADARTLYFAARTTRADTLPPAPLTYAEVIDRLRNPGNGQSDLYSLPWSADEFH